MIRKFYIYFSLFYFINILGAYAIDINQSLEQRNSFFNLEEILLLDTILDDVNKNNSSKYRENEETFFSKYGDGVVAIFSADATGSGVVIDKEGLVITNWHVIEGNSDVSIVFKPPVGSKAVPSAIHKAQVIKIDKTRDLALLRPLYPPKNINYIKFPNDYEFSEDYLVSQEAHCIGHPNGFRWTYTRGIISQIRSNEQWSYYTDKIALNEELSASQLEKELEKSVWHISDVLQVDCSINPGNSGGPIMNSSGELLGINTNTVPGSQTLNFSIALHEVRSFLEGDIIKPITAAKKNELTEEATVLEEIDYNDDGIIDTLKIDFSGNLVVDAYYIDDDYDRTTGIDGFDYVLLDYDENNIPESRVYWVENSQYEEFDIEQDGVYDVLMIDHNQDGEYEIVRKI
tara:strand:+ start:1995 stop:3200 length:1206 start_codon:yes stop_codon:yes gene_type:complete